MKLVKLSSDHYIIVDESKQPVEGYYYDNFIKDIKDTRGAEYGQADHCWQITHSTQPLEYVQIYADIKSGWYWGKIKQLSLSEVKELLGEVDVEKKAELNGHPESSQFYSYKEGFIDGYNEVLEDNKDRRFTEEDMKKAFSRYAFASTSNQPYSEDELLNQFRKFIQSLQPPTSWDVTIVDGKLKLV